MTNDDLLTRAERAAAVEYMEFSSDTRENKQETASLRAAFIDGAEWHAAQRPSREQSIDVDKLARVIDQAADDWDLGIGNGGQTWEHALARAVIAHLTKGTRTMSKPYVPDTETVREQYTREQPPHIGTVSEKRAEFDRWLRQVKAEALKEVAGHRTLVSDWWCHQEEENHAASVRQWLRDHAARIESQETP